MIWLHIKVIGGIHWTYSKCVREKDKLAEILDDFLSAYCCLLKRNKDCSPKTPENQRELNFFIRVKEWKLEAKSVFLLPQQQQYDLDMNLSQFMGPSLIINKNQYSDPADIEFINSSCTLRWEKNEIEEEGGGGHSLDGYIPFKFINDKSKNTRWAFFITSALHNSLHYRHDSNQKLDGLQLQGNLEGMEMLNNNGTKKDEMSMKKNVKEGQDEVEMLTPRKRMKIDRQKVDVKETQQRIDDDDDNTTAITTTSSALTLGTLTEDVSQPCSVTDSEMQIQQIFTQLSNVGTSIVENGYHSADLHKGLASLTEFLRNLERSLQPKVRNIQEALISEWKQRLACPRRSVQNEVDELVKEIDLRMLSLPLISSSQMASFREQIFFELSLNPDPKKATAGKKSTAKSHEQILKKKARTDFK